MSVEGPSGVHRSALVTGAHGFIGRHVCRALARRGFAVTGIGHGEWTVAEWRAWGLTAWHACDLTLDSLREHGQAPNCLIHCAGGASVPFSMAHPLEDYRRTVEPTLSVLEFVRTRAPGARVVLPSSGSVYGSGPSAVAESSPTRPVSAYAHHKLLAECLCREYGQLFGVSSTVVRLFSVYGPGLRKQLLWDACHKLTRGQPKFAGSGREIRDWVHVEDAADLLILAEGQASPLVPTVNGGSGVGTCVEQVVSGLAKMLACREPASFTCEARPGDPVAFVADPTLARAWGWSPRVGWDAGLRQYAEWFLQPGQWGPDLPNDRR